MQKKVLVFVLKEKSSSLIKEQFYAKSLKTISKEKYFKRKMSYFCKKFYYGPHILGMRHGPNNFIQGLPREVQVHILLRWFHPKEKKSCTVLFLCLHFQLCNILRSKFYKKTTFDFLKFALNTMFGRTLLGQ